MNERTTTGLEILFAAAVIGILGNMLLRATPWGLNAALFVLIFAVTIGILIARRRPEVIGLSTLALIGAMIFFGTMFVIRDSVELRVYDTIAIIVIMGVLTLSNFGIKQRVAGVFHYAAGVVWSGISSAIGPFLILGGDIEWGRIPGNRLSKGVFATLRGLAIALPLLLIFGGLFMAADAAFERFADRIVRFDMDTIVSHVLLTSFLAWLSAGYFRSVLIQKFSSVAITSPVPDLENKNAPEAKETPDDPSNSFVEKFAAEPAEDTSLPNNATILEHINISDDQSGKTKEDNDNEAAPAPSATEESGNDWQNWDNTFVPRVFTLGRVEMVIVLGLLNVLFLSFVVFQIPYLFGGMELVQTTPDLKLAEFARRGFGELVTVSLLVLPLLLAVHWLLRRDDQKNELIFRVFAGIQVILLFVIMASAMQRLILLTGSLGYGWTTVRFYPMVVIIWLAAVFVWFAWTVLRGNRQYFAWGALWAAIFLLGAVNLMNPNAFIAEKNIQLMVLGRDYDAKYNALLKDDAVPVLFNALPLMNNEDRCTTLSVIYGRLLEARGESQLRSLNWSRERAYELMEANSGTLANGPGCENYGPYLRYPFGKH